MAAIAATVRELGLAIQATGLEPLHEEAYVDSAVIYVDAAATDATAAASDTASALLYFGHRRAAFAATFGPTGRLYQDLVPRWLSDLGRK